MPLYRLLSIKSPLTGDDPLIVTDLLVTERLGLPYVMEVRALGSDPQLAPSTLLTQPITITVEQRPDGESIKRHFHGLVAEFEHLGPGASGRTGYRLVAVPGIWRLGLKTNCRIFQGKNVKDIVTAVLGEHGLPAPTWGIMPAGLQPMPYCTQFNETDLHFVSRLLEEHGMTYYHAMADGSHTLHISATAQGFPAFTGGDVTAQAHSPVFGHLSGWQRSNRARPAAFQLHDMDGERSHPSVVQTKNSSTRKYPGEPDMWSQGKVFHWPGGMATRPGVDPAAIGMGAREAAAEEFAANTRDPRFAAGCRPNVAVRAEDATEVKAHYVVTEVRHWASEASALSSGSGGTEAYSASLKLVAASRTWMPPHTHARPVMAGLYSGTVTGPEGEKIHVDEFGRIKVLFRWDHLGASKDTSSCWMRVAQSAAGAWGGTWFLPRVGDEVLVAFLDGDPDRPLVTGSVYGKDSKPPFLPGENRAQSGIRTRSYKSDSADDANILRFEDKKSSEEVFLHAQKDLNVEVEHDETRKIDHDQIETIKNSRTVTINDSHDTLTIEKGNRSDTIKKGNDTLLIEMGNRSATMKMGNDDVKLDMGNESHALKMGNLSVKCDLGAITMEAMQSITLKVGQSSLVIDQMGITLKGMMLKEESQLMHQVKTLMLNEKGTAMVKVEGGIVMLN